MPGEHLVAVAELQVESAVGEPGQLDDPRRGAHRQAEVLRVPLEVVAHLRAGGVREAADVDAQARQAEEGTGGEEPERVVALPPRVPDARVVVEQFEAHALLGQALADDEPGGAGADDGGIENGGGHDDLLVG